ncbi:ABC transporter ATP-binding protein [Kribbella deserti]|uniref:ABC transporter ATP-binding protein n=1 Tax=Kribbella deserti TaxID=1926257 RepID=A0ABV6QW17_9ACTN
MTTASTPDIKSTRAATSEGVVVGAGLTKHFGTTKALDEVSISVRPGEVVALMGPSGSGKSTLLHVLAGIIPPDAGSVHVRGRRIDDMSERRRSSARLRELGFVFQFGDLVPELSLAENVALPLLLTGSSRRAAMAQATELLAELEIAGVASRRPAEVSGGQAQRAAVARALVHQPAAIFADEPTGALDSVNGDIVLTALLDAARGRGIGLLLVTHDARVAAHADRECILRDGKLAG